MTAQPGCFTGAGCPRTTSVPTSTGRIDETVSALGIARAGGLVDRVEDIVVRLQREMFVCGAHLATGRGQSITSFRPGVSRVTPEMTEQAEREIDELTDEHPLPQEFILPGGRPARPASISLVRRPAGRAASGHHGSARAPARSRDSSG